MDGEVNAWMVVFAQLNEVVANGGSPGFAAKFRRAVASPDRLLGLAIRDHVLVTIVKENLASLRRLSKDELLLAELLAANDVAAVDPLRQHFCGKERKHG